MLKSLQTAAAAIMIAATVFGARIGGAQELVIGTGKAYGTQHSVGRALCRLVNIHAQGFACKALPTTGSEFNLSNVTGGALDFGLVPSDLQHYAVSGTGPFAFTDIPFDNLRSLFSVPGEAFTIVARRDVGIVGLDDLRGKRVNIGNRGSRQRAMMDAVMAAMDWTTGDFQLAEELPADQQSLALCHGRVHAIVYSVAHPDSTVDKVVEICDAVLVNVTGEEIEKLIAQHPFYTPVVIPGRTYPGIPNDISTFGVAATVISSSDISPQTAYAVVATVFENMGRLKKLHPSLRTLDPGGMARDGLSAPLHDGALRYYEEKGLR